MSKNEKGTGDGDRLENDKERLQNFIVDQLKYYEKMVSLGDLYKTSDPKQLGMAVAREAPGLVSDLLRSSIEMQSSLLERSTEHFRKISESLTTGKTKAASGSTIRLSMEGEPGQTLTAKFKLKNPDDEPLDVSFTVPVLRRDADGTLVTNVEFRRAAAATSSPALSTLPLARKGSDTFVTTLEVPIGTKGGCYEGTSHVVAGNIVLGHLEFVVNVKGGKHLEAHAIAGAPHAFSDVERKVKNPSPSKQLVFAPPLVEMKGEAPFVATIAIVQAVNHGRIHALKGGEEQKYRFKIARSDNAPLQVGRYEVVLPVFIGSTVVAQHRLELIVTPPVNADGNGAAGNGTLPNSGGSGS